MILLGERGIQCNNHDTREGKEDAARNVKNGTRPSRVLLSIEAFEAHRPCVRMCVHRNCNETDESARINVISIAAQSDHGPVEL